MLTWNVVEGVLKSINIVMRRVNADSISGGQFEEIKVEEDPNMVYVKGKVFYQIITPNLVYLVITD